MLMILFQSGIYAGYVIKTKVVSDGETTYTTTYFQDDKIRFDDSETDVILDFGNDKIIMIMKDEGYYMEEKISELEGKVKAFSDRMVEQMLQQVPADQREQMRASIAAQMGMSEGPYEGEVEVKSTGDMQSIAGYNSKCYDVFDNGQKVESLWISEELDIIDMEKIMDVFQSFTGIVTYENTGEYKNLMGKGMIMKSEDVMEGRTEEVAEVEKKSIPAARFSPPDGLRKVDFEEYSNMMMNAG